MFNIYDLAGDGSVSRAELTTMLNHVPRAALSMATGEEAAQGEDIGGGGGGGGGGVVVGSGSGGDGGGSGGGGSGCGTGSGSGSGSGAGGEIVAQFTNGSMVERAFAECDLNRDGRLSFEQVLTSDFSVFYLLTTHSLLVSLSLLCLLTGSPRAVQDVVRARAGRDLVRGERAAAGQSRPWAGRGAGSGRAGATSDGAGERRGTWAAGADLADAFQE